LIDSTSTILMTLMTTTTTRLDFNITISQVIPSRKSDT
jgi:hypothetical protein